jgi:DNA-binding CsgD family transcriptional regulator
MAALDPTQFEPFYKLFPELTAAQTQAVLLMALGLPGKEISIVKDYSTSRYGTLVEEARERLQVPTKGVLRTAVHLRVMLGLVGSSLMESFRRQTNKTYLLELLTPTENDLLYFLIRGLTRREIAGKIAISLPAYDFHIKNIKQKFGVKSVNSVIQISLENHYYEALSLNAQRA